MRLVVGKCPVCDEMFEMLKDNVTKSKELTEHLRTHKRKELINALTKSVLFDAVRFEKIVIKRKLNRGI